MYRIERQDQLYKTLPRALFFSPTIVVFSALTLFLPLSGVFAPGSLTVVNKNYTDIRGSCIIPTGNLSNVGTPDYESLYNAGYGNFWSSVTPRATQLITQWFVGQSIPDLPQACGLNCRYNISISSFVFKCTQNTSSLPDGQAGITTPGSRVVTVWNGTTDPNSAWGFYVLWRSTASPWSLGGVNGTSGNAYCSPFQAQYDIEVRTIAFSTRLSLIFFKYQLKVETKGSFQSVIMNSIQISTSPIPDVRVGGSSFTGFNWDDDNMAIFWNQLASISYATRALFLGNASLTYSGTNSPDLTDTRLAGQPSFLEIPFGNRSGMQFIWGDVSKGIEEMSHNVTAGLLALQLGTMGSNCSFDQLDVPVYQYSPRDLWAPYGVSTMLYSHVIISPFLHYVL